jgi:hypothetical protein
MTTEPISTPGPNDDDLSAGQRLYDSVLAAFHLDEHELTLLRQAARTVDLVEDLQSVIDSDGPMVATASGEMRVNPAVIELRQQRIVLARLIVALRVPLGDQEQAVGRTQRRGTRGVYGIRGVVA